MLWSSVERTLTIENNNVKLPVAEQLVLVGDAGPETAGPPQGQSEKDLALLLVQRNRLSVVLFHAVIIHRAQLEEQTETKQKKTLECILIWTFESKHLEPAGQWVWPGEPQS